MMTTDEKINYLNNLITGVTKSDIVYTSPVWVEWCENVKTALKRIFPSQNYWENFSAILNKKYMGGIYRSNAIHDFKAKCFDNAVAFLKARIRELQDWPEDESAIGNIKSASVSEILLMIDRFDLVTKQLRQRHDSRETLDISDEYDVQDLFHALLKLYFDDIRAEEWTPSYAGSSSRIDFFIPELKLAIEIKKTRKGLSNKEAKEQLAIDKDHYRCKENIKHLICFVYDPECRIQNPRGFEKDLAQEGPLKTDIYVRPRQ